MASATIDAAVGRLLQGPMACRSLIACRSICLKAFSCSSNARYHCNLNQRRARCKVARIQVTPLTHETGCTQPSLPNSSYPDVAAYISIFDVVSCGARVSMRSRMADLNYPHTVACKRLSGLRLRRSTPFIQPTAWQSSSEFETSRGVQS